MVGIHTAAVPRIYLVALSILALNLPFGYWRAGVRKFSLSWFLSIHLPVPMAVGIRYLFGFHFRLETLPLFICAFFLGQFLGAKLRWLRARRLKRRNQSNDGHDTAHPVISFIEPGVADVGDAAAKIEVPASGDSNPDAHSSE